MPIISRRPRHVPLSTRIVVFFGGMFAAFGWCFFSFGMIFAWIFAGNADWSSLVHFRGKLDNTTGRITASEQTGASEGGGKGRKGTPIYAHRYRFQRAGSDYEGVSYVTGGELLREGSVVRVEFPEGDPAHSRIKGMRRALFGPAAVIVLIFPAVGLGAILPSLWMGARNVRLLANGELAQGKLIGKIATATKVNNKPVFKMKFEFTDATGLARQAMVKAVNTQPLEDEALEQLFYDPRHPSRAVLLDNLPAKQTFTVNGDLHPAPWSRALRSLLLPLLAFAAVLGGFLIKVALQ